jgi:hypothetical protein
MNINTLLFTPLSLGSGQVLFRVGRVRPSRLAGADRHLHMGGIGKLPEPACMLQVA